MASSDEDRARRAELAKELGFVPATLDSMDIERHRRLSAALDAAPTREQIVCKYAHLREEHRRTEIEEHGRRELADLDDGMTTMTDEEILAHCRLANPYISLKRAKALHRIESRFEHLDRIKKQHEQQAHGEARRELRKRLFGVRDER